METRSQTIKSPSVERIRATSRKKRENRRENKTNQSQSVAVWLLLAAPRVTQMRDGSQARLMAVSTVYLLAQWICTDRQTVSWASECRANTLHTLQTSRRALKCTKNKLRRAKNKKNGHIRFYRLLDPDPPSLHRVVHHVQKVNGENKIGTWAGQCKTFVGANTQHRLHRLVGHNRFSQSGRSSSRRSVLVTHLRGEYIYRSWNMQKKWQNISSKIKNLENFVVLPFKGFKTSLGIDANMWHQMQRDRTQIYCIYITFLFLSRHKQTRKQHKWYIESTSTCFRELWSHPRLFASRGKVQRLACGLAFIIHQLAMWGISEGFGRISDVCECWRNSQCSGRNSTEMNSSSLSFVPVNSQNILGQGLSSSLTSPLVPPSTPLHPPPFSSDPWAALLDAVSDWILCREADHFCFLSLTLAALL